MLLPELHEQGCKQHRPEKAKEAPSTRETLRRAQAAGTALTLRALRQYRERMRRPHVPKPPAAVASDEILADLTATGQARPRATLTTPAQAAEWRRLARAAGRSIGRPVRTYAGPDGPVAALHDWPVDDVERTIQERALRDAVNGAALEAIPHQRGPGRPRKGTPGARERIMTAAEQLFKSDGFRASGVDTITEEADVAKASFYKYFGSRSELEVAYLNLEHQRSVDDLAEREQAHPAAVDALVDVVDAAASLLAVSPAANVFVLATVEYPETDHPARLAAQTHLQWRHRQFTRLLTSAGHSSPVTAATDLAAALDGAELLAHVSDHDTAAGSARRALARLLAEASQ
jgi:AcrR family transcriptional regulator